MNINKVLKRVLEKIRLSEKELKKMNGVTENFRKELQKEINKKKIKAEVFVGGSSGKGTVVRREKQDIDIFSRFKKNKEDISKLLEKAVKKFKVKKIHGSRDYFKVSFSGFKFEVVPVLKIKKPEQAENVTDLSYFHISYIKNKLNRNKKLADEIRLAKSFCYGNGVYGAEGYIRGFSGYSLELLILHYKSFLNMIRKLSRKKPKIIIDIERHYKGKKIEEEMNESKLSSPVIFVDPTYKERNALSALSYETFLKFQEACKDFLRKPEEKFFFPQEIDKKKYNLILKAKTNKQEGDIAGSKLHKFYFLFSKSLGRDFAVEKREFDYDDKKTADLYFKIKPKKKIIIEGPPITAVENVVKFRKKHKSVFKKNHKVYAKEKSKNIKKFLSEFKKNNKKRMKDMGIVSLN